MRLQRPALFAWLCAVAGSTRGQSTVSVYLPEYSDSDWAALRGSVISSVSACPPRHPSPQQCHPNNHQDKSVTAYTVFCADQAPSCQIAGELPFVFTEGAHTLVYKGSEPGTLFVSPPSPLHRRHR